MHMSRPMGAALIRVRFHTICSHEPLAVRGDLIRILNKLINRRDKFDAIMIETTGLANPAPVIQTFFVDGRHLACRGGERGILIPLSNASPPSEDIKEACVLDAVLCVVDSKHVTLHLDDVKPEGVVNEAGERREGCGSR